MSTTESNVSTMDWPAPGRVMIDPATLMERHPVLKDVEPRLLAELVNPSSFGDATEGDLVAAVCLATDEQFLALIRDPEVKGLRAATEQDERALMRRKAFYAAKSVVLGEIMGSELLIEFNRRYAVILNLGGKTRVVELVQDKLTGRMLLTVQTFADFGNAHRNRVVEFVSYDKKGHPVLKYEAAGKVWLDHPQRRQFDRVVFAPGLEVSETEWNLFTGFAVKPTTGERHKGFLDYLWFIVCGGDDRKYEYLLNWMARAVQLPQLPGLTAVVLYGPEGSGKTFFGQHFGKLFGQHFLSLAQAKHVVGNFNAHLRTCILLSAEEAFFAGDHQAANALKDLLTGATIAVEGKGLDVEHSANCLHLIMTSNSPHVVMASPEARRFFVCEVQDKFGVLDAQGQAEKEEALGERAEFFGSVAADLEAGGYADLLGFLMARDISGFNPERDLPQTAELQTQKDLTSEHGWKDALEAEWSDRPLKTTSDAVLTFLGVAVKDRDRKTMNELGKVMRSLGFERKAIQWQGQTVKGYMRGKTTVDEPPQEWCPAPSETPF